MKHVTILVPEGDVNVNTITGAYEILMGANEYWQQMGNPSKLRIQVAGFITALRSPGDFFVIYPTDIKTIRHTDLVIIPPVTGEAVSVMKKNEALIDWIGNRYKNGSELASMCIGAFLLAASGVLDGKTCSTHWRSIESFRQLFPHVKLVEDKIITDEHGIYTNGGGYSFLNLMLYLVEKIFDRSTAIYCSKVFQIDIERTTQSPFAIFHIQKGHGDELICKAQQYIEEHIEAKISFEKLAAELAISRRNFDRRFIKATGNTPVEYLQRVKVEAAKKELEKGRKSIFEVMYDVGYADDKAFREVFKKVTGLSPQDYRNKYSKIATAV